ncbi:MAG: hypothetical protein ACHQ51_14040 [Elusimicrobiota bacterium]
MHFLRRHANIIASFVVMPLWPIQLFTGPFPRHAIAFCVSLASGFLFTFLGRGSGYEILGAVVPTCFAIAHRFWWIAAYATEGGTIEGDWIFPMLAAALAGGTAGWIARSTRTAAGRELRP